MDVDDHPMLGSGPEDAEDLLVGESEVLDGGEELQAGKPLVGKRADLVQHARRLNVGDNDVNAVVDMRFALRLGELGIDGVAQAFPTSLKGKVHETRDPAGGRGTAPALVVVRGRSFAHVGGEMRVNVNRAREHEQAAGIDGPRLIRLG